MKRKTTKPAARKKSAGKKSLPRHGAAQQKRAKATAKAKRGKAAAAAPTGVIYSDLRRSISEGVLGRLLNS
jgi:hypothetical protein